MAKRAAMSEADLHNLDLRASEGHVKLGRALVTACMKEHPQCVQHLVAKCESLGIVMFEGGKKVVKPGDAAASMPLSRQARAAQARKKTPDAAESPDAAGADGSPLAVKDKGDEVVGSDACHLGPFLSNFGSNK